MKKYLVTILILASLHSCIIDRVIIADFIIENNTDLNLEFITFDNGIEVIYPINSFDNNSIGEYNISEQVFPSDIIDSVIVKFSDNKILKYHKSDSCNSNKSFFCISNTICINNVCTFEIDDGEYKKAK